MNGGDRGIDRDLAVYLPDLDRIVLDDRGGEQLPAHFVDPRARQGGIGLGELQFDQLALADLADPRKSETLQRMPIA